MYEYELSISHATNSRRLCLISSDFLSRGTLVRRFHSDQAPIEHLGDCVVTHESFLRQHQLQMGVQLAQRELRMLLKKLNESVRHLVISFPVVSANSRAQDNARRLPPSKRSLV